MAACARHCGDQGGYRLERVSVMRQEGVDRREGMARRAEAQRVRAAAERVGHRDTGSEGRGVGQRDVRPHAQS